MTISSKQFVLAGSAVAVIIFAASFAPHNGKVEVPYPSGFRKWAHVKSAVILEGHPTFKKYGGYHHIYANEKAMTAFNTGTFPEGSQIVFDVVDMKTENNTIVEGNRKFIDVMYKDSRFAETGGWGYDEFDGDGEVRVQINAAACYNCHVSRQKQGYVFSELRK